MECFHLYRQIYVLVSTVTKICRCNIYTLGLLAVVTSSNAYSYCNVVISATGISVPIAWNIDRLQLQLQNFERWMSSSGRFQLNIHRCRFQLKNGLYRKLSSVGIAFFSCGGGISKIEVAGDSKSFLNATKGCSRFLLFLMFWRLVVHGTKWFDYFVSISEK